MKKVLKKLLCASICFIGVYSSVSAASLVVGNDAATPGALNRKVSLELKDSDVSAYSKVSFQVSVSGTSYAEVTNFSFNNSAGLKFSQGTDGTYTIGGDSETLRETKLGDIIYKTSDGLTAGFKITLNNVVFTRREDGAEMHVGDSGIKVQDGTVSYEKIKSSEAALSTLTISQGTLTPEFNANGEDYTAVVKDTINGVRINATAASNGTVTGTGTKTLKMGDNEFEITVTSEDGSKTKTYRLNVIRGEVQEPSAFLKTLTINNIGIALSPEFDPKNNKYTVKVGEDIDELDLKYTLEDSLAEVEIEGNEKFITGENLVKITVKASDESDTQVYEITVIKEEEESVAPVVPETKEEVKKDNKTLLIIIIVVVILAVVGGVAFLLFRKKKNGKKNTDDGLPLKKRDDDMTVTSTNTPLVRPEHREEKEYYEEDLSEYEDEVEKESEDSSITKILKEELYDDENEMTRRFDSSLLKDYEYDDEDYEEVEKTKEFDFSNLEK